MNNESVKEVILPQSLVEIEERAFADSSLERIVIPDGVKKKGAFIFENCVHLRSVILPDDLEYIDNCTFKGCKELRELKLPSKLKSIGWRAL